MDARITKQRLSNLLSYDWIKMIVTIIITVGALILLFTMIATRVTNAQTFSVFGYENLFIGEDGNSLSGTLEKGNVFSYDILKVSVESFNGNSYSSAAFTARRAAGEGTVMFISSYDGEGKTSKSSSMYGLTAGEGGMYKGEGTGGGFYDPQYYLESVIKEYLQVYFGEDLSGGIDEAAARERFMQRNGKDKRFKKAAQKEAGVKSECERLEKLKEDYLFVSEAFADGRFAYTALSNETGEAARIPFGGVCPEGSYLCSIDVSAIDNVTKLFCYRDAEDKITSESVNMLIFRNAEKTDYDLGYETVSFLRYLVEAYDA